MSPEDYDSLAENLKRLPGELKSLVEKRIELFTLEVGERITGVIAHAIYRMTGIVFLGLGLILVLFAASNFVGDLLDSEGLGFVVVAAPVLLIGLIFFYRRPRSMVSATRDKMMHQFMKDLAEQLSSIEKEQSQQNDSGSETINQAGKTEAQESKHSTG